MDAHRSCPQPRRSGGRHFLSPRLAAELVETLDVAPHDVVVEIGAGSGRLTRPLCDRAGVVLAIELDPVLARGLLRIDRPNLYVHCGDALDVMPPPGPYRVVGNAPFGIGTGLLRRFLSDPLVTRLDLILQREAARKRARGRGNALAVAWAVSWAIEVAREIPRHAFHPAPGVDAAWLRARRRPEPLLPPERLPAFERFVRATFARGSFERLGIPRSALAAIDVDTRTRPAELDVERWVALHRRIVPSPADRRAPSIGG